jgi:hypothetical protein
MDEVKITIKYDEQSKSITASAGIELITKTETFLNDEKKIEDIIKVRADELFLKALQNSQDWTMRYKR